MSKMLNRFNQVTGKLFPETAAGVKVKLLSSFNVKGLQFYTEQGEKIAVSVTGRGTATLKELKELGLIPRKGYILATVESSKEILYHNISKPASKDCWQVLKVSKELELIESVYHTSGLATGKVRNNPVREIKVGTGTSVWVVV